MNARQRTTRLSIVACLVALAGLIACAPALGLVAEVTELKEEAAPAAAPASTAPPALSGTPAPGATLSCSQGTWSGNPSSFSYQWLRDGSPIAGQTASTYNVQRADQGHALSCTVTARNEGGEYTLVGLPAASYDVSFEPEDPLNYLPQVFKEQPSSESANQVSVTPGMTTAGIDASLQSGAEISGKATSQLSGLPLQGVEACAYGITSHSFYCAKTNASGEYILSGLPTDSYRVEFEATEASQNYAPQYYGDKPEAESTLVAAAAGKIITGIDAALSTGGRITGTVTAFGGGPVAGVEVCAENSAGGCAITNAEGNYTITNLSTEKYVVRFAPISLSAILESIFSSSEGEYKPPPQSEFVGQYYNDQESPETADAVSVTAGNLTSEINAALKRGGSIAGVVKDKETGSPVASVAVCLETGSGLDLNCTITSTSGEYRLEGLPEGSYGVLFFPVGKGHDLDSIYEPQRYKDVELAEAGTPVMVKAGVEIGNVSAELLVGAQISGKVTATATGAPVSHVEVCADDLSSKGLGECGFTTASGEYSLTGVAPGTYDIAFAPSSPSEYLPQFYNGAAGAGTATPLTVTAGSSHSGVNAALQTGGRITGIVKAAGGAPLAGIRVCARGESAGAPVDQCVVTQSPGPSTSATSASVAVPAATTPAAPTLTVAKAVKLNTKNGAVTFTVSLSSPGTLSWSFVFKNADVGFADAFGIEAPASIARSRCKAGFIRHHGRCVRLAVPFASGKQAVSAVTLTITLHPSAKALKALKQGHILHVSGAFVFQPAAGGPRLTHSVSTVVRLRRHRHHR